MINPSLIDSIDKYLQGQLSAPEEQAFFEQLKDNPADQDLFEILKQIGPAYQAQKVAEMRTKMQEWSGQRKPIAVRESIEKPQKASTFPTLRRRNWLSVAAIGILLIGAMLYFSSIGNTLTGPDLFAEHYERYDYLGQKRSQGQSIDEAYLLYNRKEYPAAIEAFGKLDDIESKFFKAQAELANKDYALAITDFSEYITLNGTLTNEAVWYKALAYLALNMQDKAVEQLNYLAEENSSYGNRAKILLQKMN